MQIGRIFFQGGVGVQKSSKKSGPSFPLLKSQHFGAKKVSKKQTKKSVTHSKV
jgi:hypothetical protein